MNIGRIDIAGLLEYPVDPQEIMPSLLWWSYLTPKDNKTKNNLQTQAASRIFYDGLGTFA